MNEEKDGSRTSEPVLVTVASSTRERTEATVEPRPEGDSPDGERTSSSGQSKRSRGGEPKDDSDDSGGENGSSQRMTLSVFAERMAESIDLWNGMDAVSFASQLGINKRRMYDVICILEGLGMLVRDRTRQGMMVWVAKGTSPQDPDVVRIKQELESITAHVDELKGEQDMLESELANLCEQNSERLYVTYSELEQAFAGRQVLAVHTPPGSTVALPEPLEGSHHYRARAESASVNVPLDAVLIGAHSAAQNTAPQTAHPSPPESPRSPLHRPHLSHMSELGIVGSIDTHMSSFEVSEDDLWSSIEVPSSTHLASISELRNLTPQSHHGMSDFLRDDLEG